MEKPIVFENLGQQLVGILHIPNKLNENKKVPAIVLFHGFRGSKTETHRLFVQIARKLCNIGFVILRFDFRGSGDSEGEFEDMTVQGEVSDAKKSIDFLQKQKFVDEERIGVIGLSLGGRVATILASKDERIKFIVLLSPALGPLKEKAISLIDDEALKSLNSVESIEFERGWYLKRSFFDSLDDPISLKIIDEIKVPILIIHSDNDQRVPIETSKEAYNTIKDLNEKNEFYLVKNGEHSFPKRERTSEIIEKTSNWLFSLES